MTPLSFFASYSSTSMGRKQSLKSRAAVLWLLSRNDLEQADRQLLLAQFQIAFPMYHFTLKAWGKMVRRALVEIEKKLWTKDDEEEDLESGSSSTSISVGNVIHSSSSSNVSSDNDARFARLEEKLDEVANDVRNVLQLLGYKGSEGKLRRGR